MMSHSRKLSRSLLEVFCSLCQDQIFVSSSPRSGNRSTESGSSSCTWNGPISRFVGSLKGTKLAYLYASFLMNSTHSNHLAFLLITSSDSCSYSFTIVNHHSMASFVPENYESTISCEFNTNSALLLSQLLDESHVEDCDDERLTSVIRSLEAEIIEPTMMTEDNDSFMELEWDDNFVEIRNYISDCPVEDMMNSQDCSTSSDFDDLDSYNWMDMEDMTEFGGVGHEDYYQYNNDSYMNHNNYATYTLEDQSYGSLWQDANALM
ncbi:hypothetical protein POM88_009086 [Heracleum sosnowskyi]|uniref:Uncharacterized protein n=1 Tax=Heracleum sosnowskyi TaxID=360622 RepID=A0AAD8J9Z8_9APIA|nr:hypothetical protein POM88_009086 [Heracleum sosnowskyi]